LLFNWELARNIGTEELHGCSEIGPPQHLNRDQRKPRKNRKLRYKTIEEMSKILRMEIAGGCKEDSIETC